MRQLAAMTWYVGSIVLLYKAATLLLEAFALVPGEIWPLIGAIIGVFIGLIKATYLFNTSCRKNLQRINSLNTPYVWLFFRPGFFLFLTLMVIAGATLSRLAQGNYSLLISVAIIDLSIGVALLMSSRVFWLKH
ncbi:hypothetical protein LA52FAK_01300 [Desulforhopalus sp. 52FAK]